ncbi:hypothetical protein [Actinomadura verrucosospora]
MGRGHPLDASVGDEKVDLRPVAERGHRDPDQPMQHLVLVQGGRQHGGDLGDQLHPGVGPPRLLHPVVLFPRDPEPLGRVLQHDDRSGHRPGSAFHRARPVGVDRSG